MNRTSACLCFVLQHNQRGCSRNGDHIHSFSSLDRTPIRFANRERKKGGKGELEEKKKGKRKGSNT